MPIRHKEYGRAIDNANSHLIRAHVAAGGVRQGASRCRCDAWSYPSGIVDRTRQAGLAEYTTIVVRRRSRRKRREDSRNIGLRARCSAAGQIKRYNAAAAV